MFYYFDYSQPCLNRESNRVVWHKRRGCLFASTQQRFWEALPKFLREQSLLIGSARYYRSAYGPVVYDGGRDALYNVN